MHVSKRDSLEQPDRDVGPAQGVRRDPLADTYRAGESSQRCRRVVRLHPATPLVAQQRPVTVRLDHAVDRLLRSRVQHHLGRLVALAQDSQGWLVPRSAKVSDVRGAGLRDPQAVEGEQTRKGVDVAAFVFGGGKQVGQLVAVSHGCGLGCRCGRRTRAGGLLTMTSSSSSLRNHELIVEILRYSVVRAGAGS